MRHKREKRCYNTYCVESNWLFGHKHRQEPWVAVGTVFASLTTEEEANPEGLLSPSWSGPVEVWTPLSLTSLHRSCVNQNHREKQWPKNWLEFPSSSQKLFSQKEMRKKSVWLTVNLYLLCRADNGRTFVLMLPSCLTPYPVIIIERIHRRLQRKMLKGFWEKLPAVSFTDLSSH